MCLHDRAHASHPNAMAPGIAAVLAVMATVRLRWPAQVAGGAKAGSRSLRPIVLVAWAACEPVGYVIGNSTSVRSGENLLSIGIADARV
jgi:hypothetical protein